VFEKLFVVTTKVLIITTVYGCVWFIYSWYI